MTSPGIFSRLIIVMWQRWLLYKMLIISYVEICSKPMAILLYDDFCVCVFFFCHACHSGFLEGYYFSMMICMLFVWKIKVTSESAGWADVLGMFKGRKERRKERWRWGGDKKAEGVVERWRQEVRQRRTGKEDGKEVVLLFTWKPPSVTSLFKSRRARTGLDFMESRPLNSASNIIYKQAL